ncbi:MAG: hypothetical protein ABI833_04180 [Acidobacteriota bacterium]
MDRFRFLRASGARKFVAGAAYLTAAMILGAQTPGLQMNVMYECPAVQTALKVYSCAGPAVGDWCDVETFSRVRPAARGNSTRAQVMAMLGICHPQTAAEAKAAASGGGAAAAPAGPQAGVGGFKVGDDVRVLTAGGFMDAKVTQARGNSYFVHAANGADVWKSYPTELRRIGKLSLEDHANGQYDLNDRVQVMVNGKWVESEIHGINADEFEVDIPGGRRAWVKLQSIRASTAPPPGPPKSGVPPLPGLTSCAGKIEGRYASTGGFGTLQITFRSGKATLGGGLGGDMETVECWMGGGKIYLHKPGDDPKVDMPIDINDDGTLQTPLGEIKRKGN